MVTFIGAWCPIAHTMLLSSVNNGKRKIVQKLQKEKAYYTDKEKFSLKKEKVDGPQYCQND